MKVLIADDDRQLCQFLNLALREYGWDVVAAFDALQALMMAKKCIPDAIVLDIHMPCGTGIGALEKLSMNMETSMIPILILSGSQDPAIEDRAKALGAVGYLHKPVDIEELHQCLLKITRAYSKSISD